MSTSGAEPNPAVTTTTRVARPDGTGMEFRRDGDGRVTISRFVDDQLVEELTASLLPTGGVDVVAVRGDTGYELEPLTTTTQTNSFGMSVERHLYDGGLTVDHAFDDDTNLRSTTMFGDWGEQTLEIRPDGGSTMQWNTTFHSGSETRDAAGRLTEYSLRSSDGTSHRWVRVDEIGRETVVHWDGTTTVTEEPIEPTEA